MERKNKRKLSFIEKENYERKKYKTEYYLKIEEMEKLLIVQMLKNKDYLLKIKKLDKKINRLENFNKELRNKNTKLEKTIVENTDLEKPILEIDENYICSFLQNIKINSYSYIN